MATYNNLGFTKQLRRKVTSISLLVHILTVLLKVWLTVHWKSLLCDGKRKKNDQFIKKFARNRERLQNELDPLEFEKIDLTLNAFRQARDEEIAAHLEHRKSIVLAVRSVFQKHKPRSIAQMRYQLLLAYELLENS